jgi:hypothetical protein
MSPPQPFRVAIENPSPCVDEGRAASKRLVGERVRVAADLLGDPGEPVEARVLFRGPGAGDWRSAALRYDDPADRFFGEFLVDRIGRWQWTLEAWPARAPEAVTRLERGFEVQVERERAGVGAWLELPASPAELERRLPELADLGFDVIQLAAPDFLGLGRSGKLPAGFERLVQSARARGLELALELPLTCAPDSEVARAHPGWFRERDGARAPDYWCDDRAALWGAWLAAFRAGLGAGVRAFVVAAAETAPLAFLEWIVREIERASADTILVARASARPRRLQALARLGFSQCHVYFPWKTAWWELREHALELTREWAEFLRPQLFVNPAGAALPYLEGGGPAAFRARLLLAATLAPTFGVRGELSADATALALRLNRIRRENAALHELRNLEFLSSDDPEILWYRKSAPGNDLLVAVNLDPRRTRETTVEVPLADLGLRSSEPFLVCDLLDGARYRWQGARNYVRLDPAERPGHLLRLERPEESALGPGHGARGAYTSAPLRGRFLAPEARG